MAVPEIKSFKKVVPMIYAYNTPGVAYHDGWTKIGYTEKQTVTQRINQQTHTADIRWQLAWQDNALYKDGSGEFFTDRDFHDYLEAVKKVKREPNTEWFNVDGITSLAFFTAFAARSWKRPRDGCTYDLREEQKKAVEMTKNYFENGGKEFLWNAKPRFGKTLSSYDLVRQMGFTNVLIVTNRPSIANSWADDFFKFIGWQTGLQFVSETDSLKDKQGVISRDEYQRRVVMYDEGAITGMVAFESLQGLKGSVHLSADGKYDKLKWISDMDFDLLIVDEAQEGVDTIRTERVFNNIHRKYTLYLSGTPFKALAGEQFAAEQIYNWSYADEQEAKENWNSDDYNPYEQLPRLAMFTYQLSNMISDTLQQGMVLPEDDETVDYCFDLNEFFATNESGKLIHEDEIKKFLHALSTQEKYPYSTPELRRELSHTIWILNRVASVKALAKLLKEDEVFSEYEIVIAAGDGRLSDDEQAQDSYNKVKKAIAEHEKTITLSVGQLTVGVTIPEWSGVLMLCNMQSPSSYMQAAFRAQNPCIFTRDGQRYRKETAYVFDFDPARTLIIFDEFANNLIPSTAAGRGTGDDRKENIKRLLNFFPVLGEDSEGKMVELDAAQVLSIPRRLKSQEVVRRGFMSNFLFQNIGNVFGAPKAVWDIMQKITPAAEEKQKKTADTMTEIPVNQDGEVEIPNEIIVGKTQDIFGDKIYEISNDILPEVAAITTAETAIDKKVTDLVNSVTDTVQRQIVAPLTEDYGVKKSTANRLNREVEQDITKQLGKAGDDYKQQTNIAKAELEKSRAEAETEQEVAAAEQKFNDTIGNALAAFTQAVQETTQRIIEEKPQEIVEKLERNKAEEQKRDIEDDVRAHLRGFSRTIPSFIMAYGDGHLTLRNFDDYTEDDVFYDVTGITEEEFRFLRDGGDYVDTETGATQHFNGNLFDEVVFNDSIEEFWNKKQILANYFDESHTEDIFDYIPPQKTNQIFTPKWVVKKMVDELEINSPGCFDDPNKTFADLYMKSGLYITEVVKRLFKSEKIKEIYPDDNERIQHILRKQVYGMAPTRIIYLIATNYILGFDENLKSETKNFVQCDAAEASKNGTLQDMVDKYFGK